MLGALQMKDAVWVPRIIVIIFVSCLPCGYEFPCDVYGAPPASQLLCSMSSQWYLTSFTWCRSDPGQEQLKCSLFVSKEVKVVTTPLQGSGVKVFPNSHWKAYVQASEWWPVWWVLSSLDWLWTASADSWALDIIPLPRFPPQEFIQIQLTSMKALLTVCQALFADLWQTLFLFFK